MNFNEAGDEKGVLPFLYTWKLERLSLSCYRMNWHYSHVFHAGGYNWKLALYPGEAKAKDGKCYFSLFLAVEDATPLPPHLVTEVTVGSSIFSGNDTHYSERKVLYKFKESKSEECYPFLMSLETLRCPSLGFLIVEIFDVIVHTEENEHLSPNEVKDSNTYTWTIDGFSRLTKKNYKSGPFLMKDHIWYLSLYPKGSAVDNFVSLYLELDETSSPLPTDKVYADFCIDWVDQINGENHGKRASCHFNSTEAGWGFSRFMPLDGLHEPSKGFLVNDSCIIEVTIF